MKSKTLIIFSIILFILLVILSPILYLKISYKTVYTNIIEENLIEINNKNITKNLILAVIKAESNFNEKAKSNSDAYGLMQLQFLTAQEVADKLDMQITLSDLFIPKINIKLGINYLDYLFKNFNDKNLALLSYNAGLNKVKSWLENDEIIIKNGEYITPYQETTNYLQKVLQNEKIYSILKG